MMNLYSMLHGNPPSYKKFSRLRRRKRNRISKKSRALNFKRK